MTVGPTRAPQVCGPAGNGPCTSIDRSKVPVFTGANLIDDATTARATSSTASRAAPSRRSDRPRKAATVAATSTVTLSLSRRLRCHVSLHAGERQRPVHRVARLVQIVLVGEPRVNLAVTVLPPTFGYLRVDCNSGSAVESPSEDPELSVGVELSTFGWGEKSTVSVAASPGSRAAAATRAS